MVRKMVGQDKTLEQIVSEKSADFTAVHACTARYPQAPDCMFSARPSTPGLGEYVGVAYWRYGRVGLAHNKA